MVNSDKKKIEISKTTETRSNGISKMIEESGLGADQYYTIDKQQSKNFNRKYWPIQGWNKSKR